jgi:hypothetical protein
MLGPQSPLRQRPKSGAKVTLDVATKPAERRSCLRHTLAEPGGSRAISPRHWAAHGPNFLPEPFAALDQLGHTEEARQALALPMELSHRFPGCATAAGGARSKTGWQG